jgi:hypothetical protein
MKDQQFWRARVQEGAVLNPVDRISEVLFGLIMVLTFTGAISVASDGREDIRQLLWAALGCNVAWGLVDAVMYWMNVLLERGHAVTVIRKIVQSGNKDYSRELLRNEIQPVVASLMEDEEVNHLVDRIQKLPEPEKHSVFTWRDLLSGVQIFLLVFLCTLPVALPFAFLDDVSIAMRASNGIAILQLFIGGFILAGYAGFRRFTTAMVYVVIGVLLVTLTMALGG